RPSRRPAVGRRRAASGVAALGRRARAPWGGPRMSFVVAVDSGGTFTDCVVLDDRGEMTRAKAPSTPPRYEEGVFQGVEEAARRRGLTLEGLLAETAVFAHGTTVATNILITRTGARTALLSTRGHEDAILIGR